MIEYKEFLKIRDRMEEVSYGTTGTTALFDPITKKYYNLSGQQLRSPKEYENSIEALLERGDDEYDY